MWNRKPGMVQRLSMLLLWVCATALAGNSCQSDSLYQRLKATPLDSMSEREYDYFMLKEKQCGASKPLKVVDANERCTLEVWVDSGCIRGTWYQWPVFVDGEQFGLGHARTVLPEGSYEVGLFSPQDVETLARKAGAATSHRDATTASGSRGLASLGTAIDADRAAKDYQRIRSTFRTVHLNAGERKHLRYSFRCRVKEPCKCWHWSWWFEVEARTVSRE